MESEELVLRDGLVRTTKIQRIVSCKEISPKEVEDLDPENCVKKLLETLEIHEKHKKPDDSLVIRALKFLMQVFSDGNMIYSRYMNVWYMCPNGYSEEVRYFIEDLLYDERVLFMEDPCGLAKALKSKGTDVDNKHPLAWLELNNGFFLSIDEAIFKSFEKNIELISKK
jgi:hypothetical protein